LVRVNQKASAEEKSAKRTTVDGVAAKLGSGDSFEELAKTMSDDHISGAKGGDLGWIREGSIDPELSKRAFTMKAGSVSEPFETAFGFHIMKVLEEPKVIRKPYATVMGDIRYQLRNEAKEAELKRLKEKARVAKKRPYKFDPASTPSAAPRKPIVPTLPSAESELVPPGPTPVTTSGAVTPLPPTSASPSVSPGANPAELKPAQKTEKKNLPEKPGAAAKPAAAKPAAPKPATPMPAAPTPPVEAASPPAPADAPAP
jgi:hypothetical protein